MEADKEKDEPSTALLPKPKIKIESFIYQLDDQNNSLIHSQVSSNSNHSMSKNINSETLINSHTLPVLENPLPKLTSDLPEHLISLIKDLELSSHNLHQENIKYQLLISHIQQQHKIEVQEILDQHTEEIQKLKEEIFELRKWTKGSIDLIGEKCEVQESRIVRFMDVVEGIQESQLIGQGKGGKIEFEEEMKEEALDDSFGELRIETKIIKPPKAKKLKNKSNIISSILNAPFISDLSLPPVALQPISIDHKNPNSTQFMIDIAENETTLTYIGEPKKNSFLLSRTSIDPTNILQFVLKVTKSVSNLIKFGIIDKKYEFEEENNLNIQSDPHYVCYSGDSTLHRDTNTEVKIGSGFKEEDTVIMIVLLCEGIIRWYVNGKLQAEYNSIKIMPARGDMKNMMDNEWVGFVGMIDHGDTIVWQYGQ